MRRYLKSFIWLGIICVVLGAVHGLALSGSFINWDDDWLVTQNPHLNKLDSTAIRWMFTETNYSLRYQPLTWLTYFTIYNWVGLEARAYHFVVLGFHCLNACLIFLCLRRLLHLGCPEAKAGNRADYLNLCAILGVLLWGVHPFRVESVAWVAGLTHCQALFFLLVCVWCYLSAHAPDASAVRRRFSYWGSVAAFGASMLTYPTAFGLPLVLLILDVYPMNRLVLTRKCWRTQAVWRVLGEKLPFMVISAAAVGMTLWIRFHYTGPLAKLSEPANFGVLERLAQAAYVWVYYLWKPWLPVHLSPFYSQLITFHPWETPFLLSLVTLTGVSVVVFWFRKRWRLGLALWVFHLAVLFPFCGWTEHPHFTNDRYGLTAGIAWSVLLVAGLWRWRESPRFRAWGIALTVAVLAALSSLTLVQTRVWKSDLTFFPHMSLLLEDRNVYQGMINFRLGRACLAADDSGQAVRAFRHTLEVQPNSSQAHGYLGMALVRQNRLAEATAHFSRAVELAPDFEEARYNLAVALLNQNRVEEGIAHLREILRRKPGNADAHQLLGQVFKNQGKLAEAEQHFDEARRLVKEGNRK